MSFPRSALGLTLLFAVAAPAAAQDAAEMVVRLGRLESQVRQMSGQIEELQFENRRLREQLAKFQEDVDFRFQDKGGASRSAAPSVTQPAVAAQTPASPPQARPPRRGDAFDPAAHPAAPGAPRPLGTTQGSAPLPGGAVTPGGTPPRDAIGQLIDETPAAATAPLDLSQAARPPQAPPPARGPSVAATGTADPRADYDAAYAYLLQRHYEQAEMGFRQFIQSHPRDRLVADATFWLGETYLARNRHREAAEQFLKVSTEYARSAKAPDAMLKLGVALSSLGARDQACATFAELERKFPQASPSLRQAVDREQKRSRCS